MSPSTPAKELFGRKLTPFPGPPRPIGSYADGCLAGAVPLPISGPSWQVMRLSRNRNWGTPRLVSFIERLGDNAKKAGWNGLLVGDMSQPRGGPMITGHSSHQIGLDVDIWFTPMPDHVLTREEREFDGAVSVVASDLTDVDAKVWIRPTWPSCAPPRRTRWSRAFSSTRRSKRRCAARPDRTAIGWRRCGRGRVTPAFSRPHRLPGRQSAMQPNRRAGRRRCGRALDFWFKIDAAPGAAELPPKPLTLAGLPAACKQIVSAP